MAFLKFDLVKNYLILYCYSREIKVLFLARKPACTHLLEKEDIYTMARPESSLKH